MRTLKTTKSRNAAYQDGFRVIVVGNRYPKNFELLSLADAEAAVAVGARLRLADIDKDELVRTLKTTNGGLETIHIELEGEPDGPETVQLSLRSNDGTLIYTYRVLNVVLQPITYEFRDANGIHVARYTGQSENRPQGDEVELKFPFNHPAAATIHKHFLALDVRSEEDYWSLPVRDRYLWDVNWFESQVMNGGIDQYIYNMGEHSEECLKALHEIGATSSWKALKKACEMFPNSQPSLVTELRRKQLEAICRTGEFHLDELVGDFSVEFDLHQLLLDFWNANGAKPN